MSSTLLEVTRAWHEEVERLERLIVKDLQTEPPTNNDLLYQSHRVRNRIEQIMTTTHKLIDIYEDKDNARKDEIAALGGLSSTGATNVDVFSAFYDRLQEIRENQSPHPAARNVDTNDEYEELLKEEPIIESTEEEAFGRYLDLHELYNDYINFNFGKQIEYSAYLDVFSEPERIPPGKLKFTRQYLEYMRKLLEYLIYFFKRTEPLRDLERIFSKVIAEFEDQWSQGVVEGWENENQENGTIIDLDYYSTLEDLMEVGPEKLTKALAALGLKTGGTVQERAERLLLTKHTRLEKLDEKHFAKGSRSAEQNGGAVARQPSEDEKEIALIEAKVKKLFGMLHEHGSGPVCSTSTQIKEHVNANSKLQEQLHEKDQKIHELERKMDDKDRELQALRLQIEAYKIGRSGVASTLGKLLPITHSAVHQNTTLGLEVLRSIAFGGQLVSASAMSFVASASVAAIGTSGIVHLGVGNATGGVVSIIYGLCELYRGRVDQSDSYVETLGRRDRWLLHTVAAIGSYLLCGLVAPLVYGFSFRESDNAIQKSLIAVGVSVPCILSMTALKYYVGGPPRDRTLAFLFIGSSVLASVISYFTVVLFG